MVTLIVDADQIIESTPKGPVRDAALIGAARTVEHYEIAVYGTSRSLAKHLGYFEVWSLRKETLADEKVADEKLKKVAKKVSLVVG